jgi:hypothetical protein
MADAGSSKIEGNCSTEPPKAGDKNRGLSKPFLNTRIPAIKSLMPLIPFLLHNVLPSHCHRKDLYQILFIKHKIIPTVCIVYSYHASFFFGDPKQAFQFTDGYAGSRI